MLTHGGAEKALQRLVSLEEIEVVGVFVETEIARPHSVREKLRRSLRYDGYARTMAKLVRRLFLAEGDNEDLLTAMRSRDELRNIAEAHLVPFHLVANYHTPDSIALMHSTEPDLGVIYGTNIVKESVFKIPRQGSINLHQGLAPYYRGGPPVFWELYNGESEIGLTVHYVETKVDSGAIILQDTVPLRYDYGYGMDFQSFISDFCGQLRVRCAELVAEAVRQIALDKAEHKPQDSRTGKRYRLPLKREKDELRRRLRKRQKVSAARGLKVDSGRSDEASNA
jgi:folate-dependent phosphoribosylglycinamide formyltransferase PurN